MVTDKKNVTVALAGNPNSGKTSIFNQLTGANQHVGNYAGVTVERRSGRYKWNGTTVDVLDLPGAYSLSSWSPEERVAQDELLKETLDAVVVVVDATALKRSLVFASQILQTGVQPVLCLNMSDEAKRAGQRLNVSQMSDLLGFPVVQSVGHRGVGIDELKQAIAEVVTRPQPCRPIALGDRLNQAIGAVATSLEGVVANTRGLDWVATRLLLNDEVYLHKVRERGSAGEEAVDVATEYRERIEKETGVDISLYVMQCYYGSVDGLLKEVVIHPLAADARAYSDAVDSIVVNRFLGIPIFLGVMYAIFWVTFTVGDYPMGWIETGFGMLGDWINGQFSDDSAIRSLVVDGIIGGVGGVVVFLPNIVLLFLGLALLEDTGYMSRAAFLVDRFMHRFGLHGKSFIPLMTGFGCSIPGIMATRTIENEKDRLATMLVLPLMSCGARLPIWMLLVPAFFVEEMRATALFGIYLTGILLALVLSLALRKTVLKGEDAPLALELPPYRIPTLRAVVMRMVERSGLYLKKAGTIILAISLLLWVMTSYPKAEDAPEGYSHSAVVANEADTSENSAQQHELAQSFAGTLGKMLEPVIAPLGFDWKIGVALIGAFAAKEVFVAQMGIIYAMGETDEESDSLRSALQRDYSPLVGISLMLFLLITAPCMATIAVTRRESGSWKWAMFQLGGLSAVGYVLSLLVYQIGSLFY